MVELRYFRESLCSNCFSSLFEDRVKKTLRRHRLVRDEDTVAVGVSGGKDSLVTLHLLSKFSRNPRKQIVALTVDEGVRGYSNRMLETAEAAVEQLGLRHEVVSFKKEFGFTLDQLMKRAGEVMDNTPPACSICGVLRRRLLNNTARELWATKLAIGHNLDDEIQVSLMNYVRGDLDRIARMGPEVGVIRDRKFVPRIKPLRDCLEEEVALYARLQGYEPRTKKCHYSSESFRSTVRELLNELEGNHPGSKYQLLSSTDKLIALLRKQKIDKKIRECSECSELSSSEVCKTCQLMNALGLK